MRDAMGYTFEQYAEVKEIVFEDGGATYHNRYSSWEFTRGQEGDFWKGHVHDPEITPVIAPRTAAEHSHYAQRRAAATATDLRQWAGLYPHQRRRRSLVFAN